MSKVKNRLPENRARIFSGETLITNRDRIANYFAGWGIDIEKYIDPEIEREYGRPGTIIINERRMHEAHETDWKVYCKATLYPGAPLKMRFIKNKGEDKVINRYLPDHARYEWVEPK